jgi:hypothetical protein
LAAATTLINIAKSREGAQSMVDAKVLDILLELLCSDDHHQLAANMLEILTGHDFALRLLDLNFCTQLVSLLLQVSLAEMSHSVLILT